MERNSEATSSWKRILGVVVFVILAPPVLIIFLAGGDVVGGFLFNPIAYLVDPSYRAETRARWHHMGAEARRKEIRRTLLATLSLGLVIVASGLFYYVLYHLVRYHDWPSWLERFL